MNPLEAGRMSPKNARTNPVEGIVARSPVKSPRLTAHAAITVIGEYLLNFHPRQNLSAGTGRTSPRPHARLKPRPIVFFDEP